MLIIRKFSLILGVFVIALVLSACKQLYNTGSGDQTSQGNKQEESTAGNSTASENGVTITATDTGFESSPATVSSGETITWVNDSSKAIQVGSANHPTHTINPEITGGQFVIELASGESKSVSISKSGSWGYHDHLKPSMTGTIVVE